MNYYSRNKELSYKAVFWCGIGIVLWLLVITCTHTKEKVILSDGIDTSGYVFLKGDTNSGIVTKTSIDTVNIPDIKQFHFEVKSTKKNDIFESIDELGEAINTMKSQYSARIQELLEENEMLRNQLWKCLGSRLYSLDSMATDERKWVLDTFYINGNEFGIDTILMVIDTLIVTP
jgi:hypothetical protein